jgi:hypothetical protein
MCWGVLALGFALVMAFLGAGGWIAVRHSQRIRSSVADLARDQLLIARFVHDVQMEENAMTEVLHQLAQFRPALQDHESLFRNLEQSDQHRSLLLVELSALGRVRRSDDRVRPEEHLPHPVAVR